MWNPVHCYIEKAFFFPDQISVVTIYVNIEYIY